MTAQPVAYHHDELPRVERTPDGIGQALTGARRMAFYADLGRVRSGQEFEAVIGRWWSRAVLAPGQAERIAAARAGRIDGRRPLAEVVAGIEGTA
ncbi:hypothetical protein [Streptacidiphilus jiangxiensis]|uniref:Uncharacterized protein n=1 Tax=Streptacidiphilus jiangxiensis TaxID=235985 RepID=A0A1H7P7T5_STRJI|nr:hypothetical protein [Streptacidiphilus jiangxiensis]SEL31870.1 hypothetical protein SAMN05414137_107261 [Streptacidiphilus jiangxiensis]